MKYDLDWSQCHNGLMLCTFSEAVKLMPEVQPILQDLIDSNELELPIEEYAVDVKIHMLMPRQYPCIPNWHRDFMPRDKDLKHIEGAESPLKMFMWLSGTPLTEYLDTNNPDRTLRKNVIRKPAQQWHSFTQADWHRGGISQEHTWRCFIRVIPRAFIHDTTKNVGQIRRHTQVYLNSENFKW